MSFIMLQNVGVESPTALFQNLTLTIDGNCHLGVVASNGGGKTTLLNCIAGRHEPTSGKISLSRGLRLGYVDQIVPKTMLAQTFMSAVQNALTACGLDNAAWKIDRLLDMFETPQAFRNRPVQELSGGWQKRVQLACVWATEPDALLLDEPTNHLDREKILFLEDWFASYAVQTPALIVSHDRRFLDATTDHTLFLRPQDSRLYPCSFREARHLLTADDEADSAKHERLLKEADRLRKSANALKNIGMNSHSDSARKKSKQMAARATALQTKIEASYKERSAQIKLDSATTHARVLLHLKDTILRAPDGTALFKTGALKIFQGDRIVLLGTNGAGKTVFMKKLLKAHHRPETMPEAIWGSQVVLGYADQHMTQLPEDQSPFDFISHRFDLGDQGCRTLLAGAGLAIDRQTCPIGAFSEGQKARLGLLFLRLLRPNFYLLDEPTNHVDISGQEKLEAEILAQKATCIIVSHDRQFTQNIGNRFLKIENKRLVEIDAAG